MWLQGSVLSLCILAVVALASALPTETSLAAETPVAERRTFKHKHSKGLPLLKKHKKFGGWLPHVFGKTEYSGIPTPIYKVHRYHGLEVKPVTNVNEVSFLTSGPTVESHDFVPPTTDFVSFVPEEHHFQQAVFTPAQPIYDHVTYPLHHPFLPTPLPVSPSFTFFHSAPVKSHPLTLPTPQPSPWPLNVQFDSTPVPQQVAPEIQTSHHTVVSTPTPPEAVVTPALVKIPAPAAPGAPLLPPLSLPQAFSSLPLALPSPPALPNLSTFHSFASTPAPLLTHSQPEYPYPPSDHPEKVELHHDEPAISAEHDPITDPEHSFEPPKQEPGLLQKIKGWKVEKATSALSHLHKIKPFKHSPTIVPEVSVTNFHTTVAPAVHFPEHVHPPTFQPPQVFFPVVTPSPAAFIPINYENFPPYPPQAPQQLFNSYGLPIPHDTYAPPQHFSHDRVSSAASEEKSSVLPAPPSFTERSLAQQSTVEESVLAKESDQQQQASQIIVSQFQNFEENPMTGVQSGGQEEGKTGDDETKSDKQMAEGVRSAASEAIYDTEQLQSDNVNVSAHSNHKDE